MRFVGILLVLLPLACAHDAGTGNDCPTTPETRPPFANRDIYLSFLGMSGSTTKKEALAILGTPERSESDDGTTTLVYFNGALSVVVSDPDDRVFIVRTTNRYALQSQPFPRAEIDKAAPLGRTAQALVNEFGHPEVVSYGFYQYALGGPSHLKQAAEYGFGERGELSFSCFDTDNCYCSRLEISWRLREFRE